MSKKDRKIILMAQCLGNPYCRVHVLGQNFPLSHELMDYLMSKRVGVFYRADLLRLIIARCRASAIKPEHERKDKIPLRCHKTIERN